MNKKLAGKLEKLLRVASILIILLLIANYITTIYNIHVITQQVDMISKHPFPVSIAGGEVNTYAARLRAQAERLEYSHAPERISLVESVYQDIDEQMSETLTLICEKYLTDSTTGSHLKSVYGMLQKEQEALLELCRNKDTTDQQIETFVQENIFPYIGQIEEDTAEILSGAGERFEEFKDKTNQIYSVSFIWTTFLVAAVLLVMLLYWKVLQQKQRREKEMRQNLHIALDAAQSANTAKSQFLTNMSHDIRTPLNAIVGMTAIAAAHINETSRVKDCLGKITVSSRHLLGLINDVLDMSKIESGKIALAKEPYNLPEFIHDFLVIVNPQARARQLDLDLIISNVRHEMVIGDSMRLNQILLNLVGNSLKFTEPGGKIRIKFSELSSGSDKYGRYCFVIEDTGLGMSKEFMEHIFQPFERERTSTISRTEGTGLGLAITKNLVEMMGGEITVESEKGKGTRFTVSLPLEYKDQQDKDILISKLHSLRAMVVDDDLDVCENTVQILNEIGMKGTWVATGEEAVEEAVKADQEEKGFHTIIMDWKLPGISGIEATRQIRRKVGREIPIILLTAYDWSEFEQEAREAGVTAFLSKPLFKSSLCQIMQEVAGGDKKQVRPAANIGPDETLTGRVLLVEDNPTNSEIAVEILKMFGLESEQAWDGAQAVKKAQNVPGDYYQLILMDIQMPKLDGYGATEQIRSFERKTGRKPVPIVAMTANAFMEDMTKARNAGMDGYVTKPVDIHELKNTLRKFLAL